MDADYHFKRMSEDRLIDFYNLFDTRGKDYTYNKFKLKYDTKWTGKEFLGVIAYDSIGKPVAHLGALPMFLDINGEKYLCGQISDAVIHPAHQKKGLFVQIINAVIQTSISEGLEFLYVFPSPQAYSGFIKTGWEETDVIHMYKFDVKTLPLLKIANKLHLIKLFDLYIKFIQAISTGVTRLSFRNSVLESEFGGIDRCMNFIEHKNYSYNYYSKRDGFEIWWKIDDGLSVGDIQRFDNKKFKDLQRALKRLCLVFGFHNYKIITSSGTFLDKIFSQIQKPQIGNRVYFYDLTSGLDFSKIKFNQADMNTF